MSMSEFELNLATFVNQHYGLTGEILSAEQAEKEFQIPVVKYTSAFANPDFRKALEEYGIVFQRFDKDDWTNKSLTPIQLLVANTLLDLTDTRSQKKKLQDSNVSTLTYNAWLKDPVFKDYIHRRAEQLIGDNQHEVDTALLDRVRAGDLKAIQYYNEYTGRFVQQRANGSNVDIQGLLIKVIEIIDLHVTDADAKLAIAQEFKKMIAARNMAGALTGVDDDPILVPEISYHAHQVTDPNHTASNPKPDAPVGALENKLDL